jgi:monothiol glutaredoxin
VGAPFGTYNILSDPELREGLKEFSSWPTYPQLYVDGKLIGGADIVRDLHAKGELAKLLATK